MRRPPFAVRILALGLVALALLGGASCRKKPKLTAAQQALVLRDVFPYPVITQSDTDEGARLVPLREPYLLYISEKNFNAAAQQFDAVAKAHPDVPEARFLEGVSLVLAERPADAITVLEPFVASTPSYSPARWFLGQAYFAVGKDEEALEQMRAVKAAGQLYAEDAAKVVAAADAE